MGDMGGWEVSFGEIVEALRSIFRDSACPGNPITCGCSLFQPLGGMSWCPRCGSGCEMGPVSDVYVV